MMCVVNMTLHYVIVLHFKKSKYYSVFNILMIKHFIVLLKKIFSIQFRMNDLKCYLLLYDNMFARPLFMMKCCFIVLQIS